MMSALLMSIHTLPAAAQEHAIEEVFVYAVRKFDEDRFVAAYDHFAWLADRGHADAARFALDMHRQGATVYGGAFDATRSQVSDWVAFAARPHPAGPAG